MSKKEAATSGMVVTGTLFLNSKSFCLFASQLDLEQVKVKTNYTIKLLNDSRANYPIFYKHAPIFISGPYFLKI